MAPDDASARRVAPAESRKPISKLGVQKAKGEARASVNPCRSIFMDLQKPEVQEMFMQWASDPRVRMAPFESAMWHREQGRRMSKTHF